MRQEWGRQKLTNVPRPLVSNALAPDSRKAGRFDGGRAMRAIKLYLKGDTWVADWVDDTSILELFGTTKLPTMFRAPMPAERVRTIIQHLNPEHKVTLQQPAMWSRFTVQDPHGIFEVRE